MLPAACGQIGLDSLGRPSGEAWLSFINSNEALKVRVRACLFVWEPYVHVYTIVRMSRLCMMPVRFCEAPVNWHVRACACAGICMLWGTHLMLVERNTIQVVLRGKVHTAVPEKSGLGHTQI